GIATAWRTAGCPPWSGCSGTLVLVARTLLLACVVRSKSSVLVRFRVRRRPALPVGMRNRPRGSGQSQPRRGRGCPSEGPAPQGVIGCGERQVVNTALNFYGPCVRK